METGLTTKILKTAISILIFILITVLMFKLGTGFIFDNFLGLTPADNGQYRVSSVQNADGAYLLKYTELKGSSAPSSYDNKQTIYNMDLTLSMHNPTLVEDLQANNDYVVFVIRDVMSTFRRDDLLNDRGKEYFKSLVKARLAREFGIEEVDDIYFENLVFQTLE